MAGVPLGAIAVNPSFATLAALVSAPLAGLGLQWLKLIGLSNRPGLAIAVLWRRKAEVTTIALYDMCGAAVVVVSVILLGITRPPSLVSGFTTSPLVAWGIVGLLGPLFSMGVLDRLPVRTFIDVVARPDDTNNTARIAAMLTQVRARASGKIADALWSLARRIDQRERHDLLVQAVDLIEQQHMGFKDIADALRDHARDRKQTLPDEVEVAMTLPSQWEETNPDRHARLLVTTALDFGLCVPIENACDCVEQRIVDETASDGDVQPVLEDGGAPIS